jgi:regulator of sigma E protease
MISSIQTVVAALLAFGVLVVVHELGHYLVARLCGVKILRFSVGMGKVVYSRRLGRDQTEWAISMLPLGGYVQMLDARDQDLSAVAEADLTREFTRQSVWRRIAIVAAGPIANFLLAIVIFCGLFIHGMPDPVARLGAVPEHSIAANAGLRGGELITAVNGQAVRSWSELRWSLAQLAIEKTSARLDFERTADETQTKSTGSATFSLDSVSAEDLEKDFMSRIGLLLKRPKAVLGEVLADGPAMLAGLHEGDLVVSVNGVQIADKIQLQEIVRAAPGKNLQITVRRNDKDLTFAVIPDTVKENGRTFGAIRVVLPAAPEMTLARETPIDAAQKAVRQTWETSILQLKMIGKMIIGELSWKNITGPITIADYAGQTAKVGVISYLSFIAFISISLGVMNLLPIPVLDGGLLLYYSLEVLTGRPVSARFGEIAQRAGIGILMTLMIVAVFNDIARHMT